KRCGSIARDRGCVRPVENSADIERVLEAFTRVPDGGLLLPPDITTITHRDLIVMLAAVTACQRSTRFVSLLRPAVSCHTGPIRSRCLGRPRLISTVSCVVPSQPTFQYRRRPSTKQSSILELRRRSA